MNWNIYIYIYRSNQHSWVFVVGYNYWWLESHHRDFFCGYVFAVKSHHFFVDEIYCDEDFYTIIMISTTKNPMFPLS